MSKDLESLENLKNAFTLLPGVGQKTAMRYAYHILKLDKDDVRFFANSMVQAKTNVKFCTECGYFTDNEVCGYCVERQSADTICVVKEPKDVLAIERTRSFKGLYHVLHGTISPLDNRGPDDIRIKELLARINTLNIKEVIVATNPDVDGEVTASYIAKLLKPLGIKVSRIAQGIQIGSELEYADDVTLGKSIMERKQIN